MAAIVVSTNSATLDASVAFSDACMSSTSGGGSEVEVLSLMPSPAEPEPSDSAVSTDAPSPYSLDQDDLGNNIMLRSNTFRVHGREAET